jgi:hypothetical protein
MMTMTNQAQRSLFLNPVQRTIRPMATIPREAKPKGARKFHIDPKGNLMVSSFQVEALLRAAGIDITRHREESQAEIEVVLKRHFTVSPPQWCIASIPGSLHSARFAGM